MKIVVRIFSFLLLAAAVAAVFLYDGGKPKADDAPLPVRPIKSVVVGATKTLSELHFPGVVDASTTGTIPTRWRTRRRSSPTRSPISSA